jgi:hemerythrin superfamily protein
MTVLSLLSQDHDSVRDLFSRFDSAPKAAYERKSGLFEKMKLELTVHMKVEEEIFYPALKALDGDGRKLVRESTSEHHEIHQLLFQISRIDPRDERFDDRVGALIDEVELHLDKEERQIFQFAKENCPEDQLEELGIEAEKRKAALQRQLAA